MYRLLIKKGGKFIDADLGRETDIALTFEAGNIAELGSVSKIRTANVDLPMTANNQQIFGLPEMPGVITDAPYKYLDARLYDDGVAIFGPGSKLKLTDVGPGNYYSCAMYSGLFDLFDTMSKKSIKDMDLGAIQWSTQSVADSSINDLISFPVLDYDANEPSLVVKGNGARNMTVDSKNIMPAISFKQLAERCVADHGYTLKVPTKVANDNRYKSSVIPFSSLSLTEEYKNYAKDGIISGGVFYFNDPQTAYYPFSNVSGRFSINQNKNYRTFTCVAKGMFMFKWSTIITNRYSKSFSVWLDISKSAGGSERIYIGGMNNGTFEGTYSLEMAVGDTVSFALTLYSNLIGVGDITVQSELRCEKATMEDISFPGEVPIAENLPDITQKNVIMTICQLWCLIPVIDEAKKTVSFFSFEDLYKNKYREITETQGFPMKDWSDKIDDRQCRIKFRYFSDHYQWNMIKYKETDGKEENNKKKIIKSEAEFNIPDLTLNYAKTLFELAFNATEETNINGVPMAKIRQVVLGDMGSPSLSARLLYTQRVGFKPMDEQPDAWIWTFRDATDPYKDLTRTSAQVASFAEMGMDTFINEYDTLAKGLLTNCRVHRENVALDVLDLVNFDFSIPVYINKYNRFFYVNKISNYRPGRLTEVELVCMQPIQN